MAIRCDKEGCPGVIRGAVGSGRHWEGEAVSCPGCGTPYVIGVTDDYEDDAVAFLIPAPSAPEKEGKGHGQ